MNCPVCGNICNALYAGNDEYGVIREWSCTNEDCMWTEGDPIEEEDDDE